LSSSAAQVEVAFNVCSRDTAAQRIFLKLLGSDASYKPSLIKVFKNIDPEDVHTGVEEFVREMHKPSRGKFKVRCRPLPAFRPAPAYLPSFLLMS
jgi:hypothetical protein